MRVSLTIMFSFCLGVLVNAQQEINLHFSQALMQSSATNPSFAQAERVNIALPSFAFNYGNNSFAYSEILRRKSDTSSILNLNPIIPKLEAENIIENQNQIEFLHIQWRWKQLVLSSSLGQNLDWRVGYSRDLIHLLWYGNAPYMGKQLHVGPDINLMLYRKLTFGVKHDYGRFSFGYRLKLLSGLSNVHATRTGLSILTAPDDYAISLQTDYRANTAEIDNITNLNRTAFNLKNKGVGIDLGARYKKDAWILSASVLNLGFIRWNNHTQNYTSKGEYTFTGVTFDDIFTEDTVAITHLTDTLEATFGFTTTQEPYFSYLTPYSYLSAQYTVNSKFNLGMLTYLEFFRKVQPAFSLHGQYQWNKYLISGISYSFKNKRFNQVGLRVIAQYKSIQVYGLTDNIIGLFRGRDAYNISFRAGINVLLKSKESTKVPDPST